MMENRVVDVRADVRAARAEGRPVPPELLKVASRTDLAGILADQRPDELAGLFGCPRYNRVARWRTLCVAGQRLEAPAMSGRPFLVVLLLLVIVLFPPLMRWPLTQAPAYADAPPGRADAAARAARADTIDGYAVAASNENERRDQENRRGREDNQHSDNEDDDWTPPPRIQQPAPPPPPPGQVQACLHGGESLTLTLSDGGATVRAFQGGLSFELSKVHPGSVPTPPGGIVGDLVFRVAAAPCGGSPVDTLTSPVNLGVGYRNRIGESVDESKLTLMLLDGGTWSVAPGNQPDPQNNYVSASVTGLGVYAVVQR